MPLARLALYAATAGGFALAVSSFVVEPPPLWVALLYLFLYIGLCVAGVIFAGMGMFADVVTRGPRNARGLALTFDDGPDPKTTPAVLDLLDEAGAKATFFLIGRKAAKHPELVREIAERGHAVGVHSYSHDRLFSLRAPWTVKKDLERCIDLLHELTGARPTLYRAPIGHISPSMGRVARELGLDCIGWSARGLDGWKGATAELVRNQVARGLEDGAIVLLHDASERGDFTPASIAALPEILAEIDARQLAGVRVDAWLGGDSEEARAAAHDRATA